MELHLKPKIGMGPILLGMSRQQVHSLLGAASYSAPSKEAFLQGLFVHYNAAGSVEFIEASESPEYQVLYNGVNLHTATAADVVSLFQAAAEYDENDPELGYSYIFKPLEVCLWRDTLPESEDDPDGRHFQAVGLGITGYFSEDETPASAGRT